MKPRIALLILTSLLVSVQTCSAEHRFSLADRSDEYIQKLTTKLLDFAGDYETPPVEGAVILKQGLYLDTFHDHYTVCENYILYVFNPDAKGITEQTLTVPHDRKLKDFGGWIRREDGTLERLNSSQIQILDSGNLQEVEVLFPFPAVHKGDILAWSVVSEASDLLLSYSYLLSNSFPTKYAVAYIISDGEIGYRLAVSNVMEDDFSSEVKKKKHGAPSAVKFTFIDIPAFSQESNSLPLHLREPFLSVSYRGSFYKDTGQWIYIKSWPQLALSLDDFLSETMEKNKTVKEKARSLTAGATTDSEKVAALYRFARDEIELLPSNEVSAGTGMPASVLNTGAGNFMEKGLLFAALVRSSGIPLSIGFSRSKDSGPFDPHFPSFEQFDSVVVEAPPSSGTWYDPVCSMCPAGQLPIALAGVPVFIPKIGLDEANDKLVSRIIAEVGGSTRVFLREYMDEIAKSPWCSFSNLPSSPRMTRGSTTELALYDPQNQEIRLQLKSDGVTDICALARSSAKGATLAESCAKLRFEVKKIDQGSLESSPEDIEANHVELEITFTPKTNMTSSGDVCILPPELVFGTVTLPAWDGPDRHAFYTRTSLFRDYEWIMALPKGWSGPAKPQSLSRNFGPLHYLAQIQVVNDSLRVTRSLTMDQSTVYEENLQGMDEAVQAIRAFEARSITLEKTPETPGT